jgi:hypothetical protein
MSEVFKRVKKEREELRKAKEQLLENNKRRWKSGR